MLLHSRLRLTWYTLAALALWAGPTLVLASPEPSADVERHPIDRADVAQLQSSRPHALELLERGEKLRRDGNTLQAAEVFGQAWGEAPASALLARRECEALTDLGRRNDAISACRRAMAVRGSPLDDRATVAALMSGPPSPGELVEALTFSKAAINAMPTQPWGYSALCDIAVGLGDVEMLNKCVEQLRRVAPDNQETQHYSDLRERARSTTGALTGWAAILLATLATLVHALVRWSRRGLASRSAGAAACVLALLAAAPVHAGPNDMLGDWEINDADPESSVPTPAKRDRDPMSFGHFLLDLSFKAERAEKKNDHLAAAKYYRAVAKAVPDRSVGFSKACKQYEALGDWQDALDFCRGALSREGVKLEDYQNFVRLQLAKTGLLVPAEIEDVVGVVKHLSADESTGAAAAEMQCDLGVRISSVQHLQECTTKLAALAPKDAKVIPYQWALAMKREDFAEARRVIDRAKAASMKPENVQQMEHATTMASAFWRRYPRGWIVVLTLALVAAAGAMFVMMRRRSTVSA